MSCDCWNKLGGSVTFCGRQNKLDLMIHEADCSDKFQVPDSETDGGIAQLVRAAES